MQRFIALLLCLAFPVLSWAADANFKVTYDGGSLVSYKAGAGMNLVVTADQIRITQGKRLAVAIPAAAVTEITYGQDVHRRVGAAIGAAVFSLGVGALLALTKSKKHYVGITWDDHGQKGGIALQADKRDYRGLLAGLEGVTGKKAVDSDAMSVKN